MVGYDQSKEKLPGFAYVTSGAVSGVTARSIAQPLDVLKIRFQVYYNYGSEKVACHFFFEFHQLFCREVCNFKYFNSYPMHTPTDEMNRLKFLFFWIVSISESCFVALIYCYNLKFFLRFAKDYLNCDTIILGKQRKINRQYSILNFKSGIWLSILMIFVVASCQSNWQSRICKIWRNDTCCS